MPFWKKPSLNFYTRPLEEETKPTPQPIRILNSKSQQIETKLVSLESYYAYRADKQLYNKQADNIHDSIRQIKHQQENLLAAINSRASVHDLLDLTARVSDYFEKRITKFQTELDKLQELEYKIFEQLPEVAE